MIHISGLQNILSQNIAQQAVDIERVHTMAVEAHTNVELGNKELKQALANNNDFRWAVFFFLIMCSVTLLILEWKTRSW